MRNEREGKRDSSAVSSFERQLSRAGAGRPRFKPEIDFPRSAAMHRWQSDEIWRHSAVCFNLRFRNFSFLSLRRYLYNSAPSPPHFKLPSIEGANY